MSSIENAMSMEDTIKLAYYGAAEDRLVKQARRKWSLVAIDFFVLCLNVYYNIFPTYPWGIVMHLVNPLGIGLMGFLLGVTLCELLEIKNLRVWLAYNRQCLTVPSAEQ